MNGGEPKVAEAYRASSACCSCLMTLNAAGCAVLGNENRHTWSPGSLMPYSIVLGPCGVDAVICRSVLVYVADRPCSVRGETPNKFACRSSSWNTKTVSSMSVLGIRSFPWAIG